MILKSGGSAESLLPSNRRRFCA